MPVFCGLSLYAFSPVESPVSRLSTNYAIIEWKLTRIHHSLRPHLLHTISTPLHSLVVVDRAIAVIVCIVLGFDLGVVDVVLELQILQCILHLLLVSGADLGGFNDLIRVITS